MSAFDRFAHAAEEAVASGANLHVRRHHSKPKRWNPRRYWPLNVLWMRVNGWTCVWKGTEDDLVNMFAVDGALMGFTGQQIKVYTLQAQGVTQLWLRTGASLWTFVVVGYLVWLVGSHL